MAEALPSVAEFENAIHELPPDVSGAWDGSRIAGEITEEQIRRLRSVLATNPAGFEYALRRVLHVPAPQAPPPGELRASLAAGAALWLCFCLCLCL